MFFFVLLLLSFFGMGGFSVAEKREVFVGGWRCFFGKEVNGKPAFFALGSFGHCLGDSKNRVD